MVTLFGIEMEIWAIIISIVALIIVIFKDFIYPFIFKPRLKVIIDNSEEYVRNATSKEWGLSRWARIKLKNKDGFFTRRAQNCYVKLLEIKNKNKETISPFDQAPLNWTVYKTVKNDLSKGESHFIDLVYESTFNRALYPATITIPNMLLSGLQHKLGPGKYYLKIGVYGDNFNSFEENIVVEFEKEFGKLKFII